MSEQEAAGAAPAPETNTPAPAPQAEPVPVSVPSKAEQAKMSAEDLNAAEDKLLRETYRKAQSEREAQREVETKTPQRNDKGQFEAKALQTGQVASDQPAKAAETKPESEVKSKEAEQPKKPESAAKTPETKPAVEAPKHWNEAQRKAFATLDPEAQQAFAKESTELRQTVSRQGNVLKTHEPTLKLAEAHKDAFKNAGRTFHEGVEVLLHAHERLNNPQTVQKYWNDLTEALEAQHGVKLSRTSVPAEVQQAELDDDWADPQVRDLKARLERQEHVMQSMLAELQRREQAEQQRQLEARNASIADTVDQFAKSTEDFDQIPDELLEAQIYAARAMFPQASPQELLSKAMEWARWANEPTRDSYADKRAEARSKQAEQARRAASLNINGHPNPSEYENEDDALRAVYRRSQARAN